MAHSYPEEVFLQDFQSLGEGSSSETIFKHISSKPGHEQSWQWRFNVFCKTITVLNEFKKGGELQHFRELHPGYSEIDVLSAVARAVHFLVTRNIGGNLSYQPSWDETGLTAKLYLEPLEKFARDSALS